MLELLLLLYLRMLLLLLLLLLALGAVVGLVLFYVLLLKTHPLLLKVAKLKMHFYFSGEVMRKASLFSGQSDSVAASDAAAAAAAAAAEAERMERKESFDKAR